VGLLLAVIVVASTFGLLFVVRFRHHVDEASPFAIRVPYNASESECSGVTLNHAGKYSFTVQLPGQASGNVYFLTVARANGSKLYDSPGDSEFSGSFAVDLASSVFEFCLRSPGINYTYLGGAATGLGILLYTEYAPVL
jgi:hypothetical protein